MLGLAPVCERVFSFDDGEGDALTSYRGLPDGLDEFVGVAEGVEAGFGLFVGFDGGDEVVDDGGVVADLFVT